MTDVVNIRRPLGEGEAATESSFAVNLAALVLAAGGCYAAFRAGVTDGVELFLLMSAILLVATGLLEWAFFGRRSALGSLRVRRALSWRRVACRETALLVTFAVIGLGYWTFPAFSLDADMVRHYYRFLGTLAFLVLPLSVPYFCLMDRLDVEEEDALCLVGRAILTRRRTMSRFAFANYCRSWLVKAFWLAIMQPQMVEKIRVFVHYRWEHLADGPVEIYIMASTVCFALDLTYASSGYLLNFRLLNTQTRSAEPTLLGWAVTLACYWPFWGILFSPYFFDYDSGVRWYETLFPQGSALWWTWAGAIVVLEALYALATVAGGIRFSNLTYRGLWNTGLYRWTKHPAYVFKNLSWWLVAAPFLLNAGGTAVRCTLLLLLTNVLYYLRARTEERHLSHYPEYVAYAREMNDRSIFRRVTRLLPFLKYAPVA